MSWKAGAALDYGKIIQYIKEQYREPPSDKDGLRKKASELIGQSFLDAIPDMPGDHVVFGSGPLAARGIGPAKSARDMMRIA